MNLGPPERGTTNDALRVSLTSVARGGLMNIGGGLVYGMAGLTLTVAVTRALGSAGAGGFFQGVAIFSIATVVVQAGAMDSVLFMLPRYPNHPAWLWRWVAIATVPVGVFGALVGLGLWALAGHVHTFGGGGSPQVAEYVRFLAPIVPAAAVSGVLLSVPRAVGWTAPYVLVESVGKPVLRAVLAVVLLAIGAKGARVGSAIWGIPVIVGAVAALVACRVAVTRRSEDGIWTPAPRSAEDSLYRRARLFWHFAAFRAVADASQVGLLWLDVLLVGSIRGASEAGVYASASRVIASGTLALGAAIIVIGPEFSRLVARGQIRAAMRVYQISTVWISAASFPVFVALGTAAPTVMRIFGSGFEGGASAMAILCVGMLFGMATGPVSILLPMAGRPGLALLNTVAALAVNVILNVLLIPPYGASGAAAAWTASIGVSCGLPVIETWVLYHAHPFTRPLATVGLAAAACLGLPELLVRSTGAGDIGLIGTAALGLAAYATVTWRARMSLGWGALKASSGDSPQGRREQHGRSLP